MRAQTRSDSTDRASARQRRADRMAQAKLNRAQMRAMEVRAAETLHPHPSAQPVTDDVEGETAAPATLLPRRGAPVTRRPVARPIALTKEQEYRFIRTDLRRLGLTAGALFVVMIALLFVVE